MRVQPFGTLFPCLLLWTLFCRGQEYLFVRYTPKDGLINSRARFLYQDIKGRMYISTFGGLSVYDGSRFVNYGTGSGLSTSLVNDVVEMGDDSVWIVPNARALHVLVHGILRNIVTTDHFYPITNQLVKCSDGYYYAVADDGLFRWEGGRFAKVSLKTAGGKEAGPYLISGMESDGWLFLLTDPHLGSYPGIASVIAYNLHTRQVLTIGEPNYIISLSRGPSGEVYATTLAGVRVIDRAAMRGGVIRLMLPPAPYGAASGIQCGNILFDRDAVLWLSTGKELLRIDSTGVLKVIGAAGGLPSGSISSLFQDKEGNLWLTNTQNGIARLVSRQIQWYGRLQPDFTVDDIIANPANDSIWSYDNKRHNLLLQIKANRRIFHGEGIFPLTGHILFGKKAYLTGPNTIYELQFLPGSRFRAVPIFQDSIELDNTGRVFADRRGRLIVPSTRMTVAGDGRIWQRKFASLCDQAAIDKYNRIWAVDRSDSLSLLRLDTAAGSSTLTEIASWMPVAASTPRSVAIDDEGHVWVGTRDHGVFCLFFDGLRFRSSRQLTIENGLSENWVRYLYCDPDNTVWVGTPSGLNRISLHNDSFTVTNVLPGHEMSIEKISREADGTHWVLTYDGYLKINPSVPGSGRYRPAVLFSQVRTGNEWVPDDPGHPLSLPYDQNALSFYVGVPSFVDERQTRFSYWLEGSGETQWSPPSDQSAINFVNLPPGHYTLHVKAQFLSGVYGDETGVYSFQIRPPWWQTTGIRVLVVVLAAGGIAWGLRNYTLKRLAAQRILLERQQAVEKERTRIATDMHDDLGAGLSRIKFLSETIGIKQQRRQPFEEEIDGIREYSKEMIDKMGEIVWALNQKNDLLSDLLSYTRAYAADYLVQAGIGARIDAPEDFPFRSVTGEFRRNVYLVVKEALHNIVKHAQAQNVYIRMEAERQLLIVLEDDGVGFDRAAIRAFANGIQNMEKRIADLGGKLTIRSGETGRGTTVTLLVPI